MRSKFSSKFVFASFVQYCTPIAPVALSVCVLSTGIGGRLPLQVLLTVVLTCSRVNKVMMVMMMSFDLYTETGTRT